MKLDDLRALVAFADHGSVSRAARHLHLSQPALSRRLQRLESSMGGRLLDRSAKPPRLSAFGARVCDQARAVLRETAGLRALAASGGEPRGILRIGGAPSVSHAVSLEILRLLNQRFPQLRLDMRSDSSPRLLGKVQSGELDAAAVLLAPGASPPADLVGARIGRLRVRVVAGKRYAIGRSATLAQLAAHPWVLCAGNSACRDALRRALEDQGHELRITVSEHGVEPQLALVSAGAGLGCATEVMLRTSTHRKSVRCVEVDDLDLHFDVWLVRPPHAGAFAPAIGCYEEVLTRRFGAAA
jgi:DNA-binding transcriptional LysR family regulator